MSVPKARLLDLLKVVFLSCALLLHTNVKKVQCRIFNRTFNPENVRTGNKVLRQRLKGPALASWYPKRGPGLKELMQTFPELQSYDEKEEQRLEHLTMY